MKKIVDKFPRAFGYARKIGLTLALLAATNIVVLLVTALTLAATLGGSARPPEWFNIWATIGFAPLVVAISAAALVGLGYAVVWLVDMWQNA